MAKKTASKKGMHAHNQFPYGPHKPGQGGTAPAKKKTAKVIKPVAINMNNLVGQRLKKKLPPIK